jgi:hypothetical protein
MVANSGARDNGDNWMSNNAEHCNTLCHHVQTGITLGN